MRVKYSLLTSDGIKEKGTADVQDIESFVVKKERIGSIVEYVKPIREINFNKLFGVSIRDLKFFCSRMSNLLSRGIVLTKALESVTSDSPPLLKSILADVTADVWAGESLSSAIKKHKDFPEIVGIVLSVGEGTKDFSRSFERLESYFDKRSAIKSKIREAMLYPIIVLVMSIATMIISSIFVLPKLFNELKSMNVKPGALAMSMVIVSNILTKYYYLVIIVIVLLFLLGRYLYTVRLRRFFDKLWFKLPVIGKLYRKTSSTEFANNLAILSKSGIKIIHALDLIVDGTRNSYAKYHIVQLRDHVIKGEKISDGMSSLVFDETIISIIRTGEESGDATNALLNASSTLSREVEEYVDTALKIVNPIFFILVSLVSIYIIFAIYMPIINMERQYH
jgi:general secretion pathway protein F